MKKLRLLCGILCLPLILSCSNDDEDVSAGITKRPLSLEVKNSEGITWEYQFYYSNNLITRITDNTGISGKFIYDLNDKLKAIEYDSGEKVNYFYSDDQLSSVKYLLARGYTREVYLFYNNLNQINKSVINENNQYENTYFYKYDSMNRLVETINDSGDSETYEYDNANNPFKNVYPQMDQRWQFSFWIKELKNNLIANDNLYGEKLSYEYSYDSDNYPVLVKEIGSGTMNYSTTITYE